MRAIGAQLGRVAPAFDRRRFERLALGGLESLELKARAEHIADVLEATLPADFAQAAAAIEASLAPVGTTRSTVQPDAPSADGLRGWAVWPLGVYIARRGLGAPERALQALHALTQRFTAEWPIRAFIEAHPELTFATLATWTRDPSEHVRRLASEGSRPRLPWGLQLKGLIADPAPTLPLLLALQDDESEYVRRSVANHLNDIAKDHPALVAEWIETHLPGADERRRALLRHASRTLVKKGDPRILKAWGVGGRLRGTATLAVAPRTVAVGESLTLAIALVSTARKVQKLVVDYAVHHVKASGATSPKVFKGWTLDLGAGEARTLRKSHSMRVITTRRYFAGRHEVDLRVNGEIVARAFFELRAGAA